MSTFPVSSPLLIHSILSLNYSQLSSILFFFSLFLAVRFRRLRTRMMIRAVSRSRPIRHPARVRITWIGFSVQSCFREVRVIIVYCIVFYGCEMYIIRIIITQAMSDIFTSYEQQLILSLTQTQKKIQTINQLTNQKKQLAFVDIKEDQKQCEKLLKMMEAQVNALDVQIKFQYSKKVRQYKRDLEDGRKRLFKAEEEYAFVKNKEMLVGAQLDEDKSGVNRQKLLKQGQMLSDTNYKLKDSVRVMRQNEQISNNVEIQLVSHTQKMKDNKEKLLEMQDDIGSSEKKIKSIMLRIKKHKLTLFGSIGVVVLIGVIALIVHFAKK